ncbi:MAG: Double zinc ribbon [Clostridiales bacterium]|jgi:DNA-directed RNA polymerase subunit RPC12/RpoP|uniref:ZZ-type domain-containing protein n=1 Tax=Fusibacter paucivorans TaxID=76009 RepID=A0ABS5PTC8_9FIRM|nr:hypothetical protein [Fusibacter paucivorans]MBS7528429.1 hypothetical protein [Fusibacter paucivorans]MDK2868050.1 Double zinc ribbon [Clostridiales bacterium]MDN5300165.1 Double zinc ribbon [Clostridiales bacterium]
MQNEKVICPNCGKEIANGVIYKCVRCFTEYCVECDNTRGGKSCPKCGMGPRLILNQKKA